MDKLMSTVDLYFKNREIPYKEGVRLGDTVELYPDTFVVDSGLGMFAESALGVTPIRVTLSGGAANADTVPDGAFWTRLPSGCCLFGTKWTSGETRYAG